MNKKITARTKKSIAAAIAKLNRELDKSNAIIRMIHDFRRQFRGFEALESAEIKTHDQEKTLAELQKWVIVAIQAFEALEDQNSAIAAIYKPQYINSHRNLEAANLRVLEEGKHFKKSGKDDKKFLAKIEKSRKAGYKEELTFFN